MCVNALYGVVCGFSAERRARKRLRSFRDQCASRLNHDGVIGVAEQLSEEHDIARECLANDARRLLLNEPILMRKPFHQHRLDSGRIGSSDDRGRPETVKTVGVGQQWSNRLLAFIRQTVVESFRR
jgi:hypothetical protein